MVFKNIFQKDIDQFQNENENENENENSEERLLTQSRKFSFNMTKTKHGEQEQENDDKEMRTPNSNLASPLKKPQKEGKHSRTELVDSEDFQDEESTDTNDNDSKISPSNQQQHSSSVTEEKRRKNVEASIRFRLKRKNKHDLLKNQLEAENEKIDNFKSELHRLEIENSCLRKMLIGNWNPISTDSTSRNNNNNNDSTLLSTSINNANSNTEILEILKGSRK